MLYSIILLFDVIYLLFCYLIIQYTIIQSIFNYQSALMKMTLQKKTLFQALYLIQNPQSTQYPYRNPQSPSNSPRRVQSPSPSRAPSRPSSQPSRLSSYYIIEYNLHSLAEAKLIRNLDSNIKIFTTCKQLIPNQNLCLHKKIENKKSPIKKTTNSLNSFKQRMEQLENIDPFFPDAPTRKLIYIERYLMSLDEYIGIGGRRQNGNGSGKAGLSVQESVELMKSIVEAVYCVVQAGFYCVNVRAENFVIIEGKNNQIRCKLASVPCMDNFKRDIKIDSPLVFKSEYQAPEHYEYSQSQPQKFQFPFFHTMTSIPISESLQHSLVWNLGCLWFHMLYGQHFLNSMENIRKFCFGNGIDGTFAVKTLGIQKDKLAQNKVNYKDMLAKMLAPNPGKRYTLQELFWNSLFGENIMENKQNLIVNQIRPVSQLKQPFPLKAIFQNDYPFYEMKSFCLTLAKIIKNKKYDINQNEMKVYKQICNFQVVSNKQTNQNSINKEYYQQNFINLGIGQNKKQLRYQTLVSYLRPYKHYFNKIIFLSKTTKYLAQKLHQLITNPPNSNPNFCRDPAPPVKPPEDLLLKFIFCSLFLRLIYSQTLLQTLSLSLNPFNLPSSPSPFSPIHNPFSSSSSPEFQSFVKSPFYSALQSLIENNFAQLQKQFFTLIDKNKYNNSITDHCRNYIGKLGNRYRKYSLVKFMPEYGTVMRDVWRVVDIGQIGQLGIRRPRKWESEDIARGLRNVSIAVGMLGIQSGMFQTQGYWKLFGRYMHVQIQTNPSFITLSQSLYSLQPFNRNQNGNQIPLVLHQSSSSSSPPLSSSSSSHTPSSESLPSHRVDFKAPSQLSQKYLQSLAQHQSQELFPFDQYYRFLANGSIQRIQEHLVYVIFNGKFGNLVQIADE